MTIVRKLLSGINTILQYDKQSVFYIVYYSLLEGILVLSIPLATAFIVNSVIAHSSITIVVLGIIVSVTFLLIAFVKLIQEYVMEKFAQKLYVLKWYNVAERILFLKDMPKRDFKLQMVNYFFDITTIQKLFPTLLLDGLGLVIQIFISLILLLAFNEMLFQVAFVVFGVYLFILVLIGKKGVYYAIDRSDIKHKSIYFLQTLYNSDKTKEELQYEFNEMMDAYVRERQKVFYVAIKQLALSFVVQALVITGFLILGAFLVIGGTLPLGEFMASEIIIVSMITSISTLIKKINSVYDIIEGIYKTEKLSRYLKEKSYEHTTRR